MNINSTDRFAQAEYRARQLDAKNREAHTSNREAERARQKQVDAQAKQEAARAREEQELAYAQTGRWITQATKLLQDIDRVEAKPVAAAIRRAERAHGGSALMIVIRPGLAVTGHGLRFVGPRPEPYLLPWPDHDAETMLFRLKQSNVLWCLEEDVNLATLGGSIREFLKREDLEGQLVYAGVDEWPVSAITSSLYGFAGFALCLASMATLVPILVLSQRHARKKNEHALKPLIP